MLKKLATSLFHCWDSLQSTPTETSDKVDLSLCWKWHIGLNKEQSLFCLFAVPKQCHGDQTYVLEPCFKFYYIYTLFLHNAFTYSLCAVPPTMTVQCSCFLCICKGWLDIGQMCKALFCDNVSQEYMAQKRIFSSINKARRVSVSKLANGNELKLPS